MDSKVCRFSVVSNLIQMSALITPESLPPEEKFSHGMIRVIPLESFGDGARDPRKIARKKLPLSEGLLPDGQRRAISDS